jgi:hypothetical protein
MNRLEPYFWVAGVLQWLVAASNVYAARIFRYRQEMAKVSPFVREVFVVQNVYIMATVATFGVLCLRFAPDLAGRTPLGTFLSGSLAIFWGGRIAIQLFFYDRDVKRARPVAHLAFLATFVYLCGLFAAAALGPYH